MSEIWKKNCAQKQYSVLQNICSILTIFLKSLQNRLSEIWSTLLWQNTNLKVIDDSLEFYQWVLFVYFYDPSWPFSFNISKWEASSLDICQTLRIYNAKGSFLTLDNLFYMIHWIFLSWTISILWLKHA